MKRKTLFLLVLSILFAFGAQMALGATGMLTLPGELKTVDVETFYGDKSLKDVSIPYGVTRIMNRAFANSSVEHVVIPGSVQYIAPDAFDGCDAVRICAPEGSYASSWASAKGLEPLPYGIGKVTAEPVGSTTESLSFKVVDQGISFWTDSIGSKRVFAFIAIRNTGKKYIYMDDCTFDYEDGNGHLVDNESWVSSHPNVIAPGETGYFYTFGSRLDDSVDLSGEVNLLAQFSLVESEKELDIYTVLDTSLDYVDDIYGEKTPVIKGRVKNHTGEDGNEVYVAAILRNSTGRIMTITGTTISKLFAGSTVGFSIEILNGELPSFAGTSINSYEIIAKPYYYQYNG